MKTKQISCPNCGGQGFITTIYVIGQSSQMCSNCNGLGLQEAVATNADRIRAMSDEELEIFISEFKDCGAGCLVGKGIKDCTGLCATTDTLMIWLQKPVEEK